MKNFYALLIFFSIAFSLFAQTPTSPSSSIVFSNVTTGSFTISWNSGNGSNRIVVLRQSGNIVRLPVNNNNYNSSTIFGNGSNLGNSNYVVYDGAGSSVTVTGLSAATTYIATIFEYNTQLTIEYYLTSSYPSSSRTTLTTPPTTPASSIVVSNITPSSATATWTNGNGSFRIVALIQSSSYSGLPTDGTTYSSSTVFGFGSLLGTSARVVYKGTGTSITVSGLTNNSYYTFAVFEYNGSGGSENYLTTGYPSVSFLSQASEPTVRSSSLNFNSVTENSMLLSWNNGNGSNRIVTAKLGSSNTDFPSDFTGYTANSIFGSGTQIGSSGCYVVYNGNDDYVTVTGLSPNTTYAFSIYEYNGFTGSYNYLTSSYATGSKTTLVAEPTVASNNLSFSGISTNSLTVSWTNGNGSNRILAVKPGRKQTGVAFDGVDDNINIPHHAFFNTMPITISAWIKTTQTTSGYCGIVNKYTIGSYNGYQIYTSGGYLYAWYFNNGSNYIWPGVSPGSSNAGFVADGKWHHIAYVVDNNGGNVYVDGVLKASNSWTGTPSAITTTQDIKVGYCPGSSGAYFNGQIDEVQIWNIAATQTAIRNNMNKSLYGTESGLLGYWKLDDGYTSGTIATNNTLLTGINGTLTNFSNTTAASNFTSTSGWVNSGALVNLPLDQTPYIANTTFLSGTQIGNGYYTVYNGNANSASVTSLTPGTYYNFALFDYNGTSGLENYLTNAYATADQQLTPATVPIITSFSPTSGVIGTSVTINGNNFSSITTDNIVFFGATRATVTSATSTQLTVIVPSGANYQPISVTVNTMTSYSARIFVVTSSCSGTINSTSFASPTYLTSGGLSYDNANADIDGDGKPDLLVSNYTGNSFSVFRNISNSSGIAFAAKADFTCNNGPLGIVVVDLDGDGKKDVATSNYASGTVSLFRNTSSAGSISFANRIDVSTNSLPWSVEANDIDRDGKTDIVVGYSGGDSITVYRNISSIGFLNLTSKKNYFVGVSADPRKVAISDIDLDGKPDIAVASYNTPKAFILRNTSAPGSFSMASVVTLNTTSNARSITIGDLDNDNKPEIVVSTSTNNVSVYKNTSTSGSILASHFTTRVDLPLAASTLSDDIALADIDGDGSAKTDIVVGYESGSKISVIKNQTSSSISFASAVDYVFSGSYTGPRYLTVDDFNADSKPDMVASANSTNALVVFQNGINALSPEPTSASSSISFTNVTTSAVTINWASGNGANRLVIAKLLSNPLSQAPFDAVGYSANSSFGNVGSDIGGGNYVVYNGNGNSVTITNLNSNTTYAFAVVEYNGSVACENNYLTTSFLFGTQTTLNVSPTLSAISSPAAICQSSGQQTINLSGITSGSVNESQTLSISAFSNNTSLIPHPTVNYTSPNTTGSLNYTPVVGMSGTAVVLVTVNDGASNNATSVRAFTVTVSAPPTAASAGINQQICAGQTNLSANAPSVGTGVWSVLYTSSAGINITSNTNPSSTITGFVVNDSIRLRWTISNGACTPSTSDVSVKRKSCPLTADFTTTSNTTQCINNNPSVTFTNTSNDGGNTVVSWVWDFGAGANPATATGQGPHVVTYSTSGLKDIELTITDNNNIPDSETKNGFINIVAVPSAAGTVSGSATVCEGQLAVNYSVPSISNATSYMWTLPSGAQLATGSGNNAITVDYLAGSISGSVTVAGTNNCGTGTSSSKIITITPLPATIGTIVGATTICEGSSQNYVINTVANASSYTWSVPAGVSIVSGQGSTNLGVTASGTTSGNIVVYASNSCGDGGSNSVAIAIDPLPEAPGAISGQIAIDVCPPSLGIAYSVGFINNVDYYLWTLPNGADIVSGDSTNAISVDYSTATVDGNILVSGKNACGVGPSSTLPIVVNRLPEVPICMVTVDSLSNFNKVIWEKPTTVGIDSFRVYRQIGSTWTHIGSVHYDSLSVYDDSSYVPKANPKQTQYLYKISVVDTCGSEWNLSEAHQTMHLTVNQGSGNTWNLMWNFYDGAPVNEYYILRDTTNTGNFVIIDSVGSTVNTYTDLTPSVVDTNNAYRVATKWSISCNPTRYSVVNTSLSNEKGKLVASPNSIKNDFSDSNYITISPNPSNGLFWINYTATEGPVEVEISNIIGATIYSNNIILDGKQNKIEFDLRTLNLAKGMYRFMIYNNKIKNHGKIIIQ